MPQEPLTNDIATLTLMKRIKPKPRHDVPAISPEDYAREIQERRARQTEQR